MIGLLKKIKAWLTPIVLPTGTPTKYPDEWAILKKFNRKSHNIEYSLLVYYYAGLQEASLELTSKIENTRELELFYDFITHSGTIYKSPKTGEILENDELEYLVNKHLKAQLVTYKEYRNYIN